MIPRARFSFSKLKSHQIFSPAIIY
jgi:hypothetical protein